MSLSRPTAIIAGVLFLLTEVGAIAGAALYSPLLNGTDHIAGAGADDRILGTADVDEATLSLIGPSLLLPYLMYSSGLVVALPVFAWELALAVWLIVKGFRPVSILTAPAGRPTVTAAA